MKRLVTPLIIGDIIGFVVTFLFAYISYKTIDLVDAADNAPRVISWNIILFYIVIASMGILYFRQKGHYSLAAPWWQQVKHICNYSLFSLMLFGFFFFVLRGDMSRAFIVISWITLIPVLMIARQIVRKLMITQNKWAQKTIILGGFENAIETVFALKSESYIQYDIQCVILPESTPSRRERFCEIHPCYKVQSEIPEFEADTFVVICPDTRRELKLAELTSNIMAAGSEFAFVPPIEGFSSYGLQTHYFFGYNIVLLRQNFRLHGTLNQVMKNIMDRAGAAVGLFLLSPLFVYIALQVKKDGGSVFFGHTRLGKNGKTFKCWKFRSMIVNAQDVLEEVLANDPEARKEWEAEFKLKNDPRITKIGSFLRKSSLDEIPQLFNVLRGEMSLVGPRPIVADEIKFYGDKIKDYYAVRPGITGLWQASGRNDVSYDLRVYLDSWYVRHWSVWTDIVIIIKTIFALALKRGAY